MTDILEEFVNTLNDDIIIKVAGHKNSRVLRILKENGIEVPQEIIEELDARKVRNISHDCLIDSMAKFKGHKPSDSGIIVKG